MPRLQAMLGECRFLGMILFNRLLVFSEPSIEVMFGLPGVMFVAIFAWNGIDYTARLIFSDGIFRLEK